MGLLQRLTRSSAPDQPIITRDETVMRDVEPLEGTNMSMFNSVIPNFWAENGLSSAATWWPADGRLAERVWVASRCIQLNSQQIASMPLRFEAPNVAADGEPAWLSSPDPAHFPNGVGDALFAIVAQLYGWGFSCLYIINKYFNGFARNWTVLDSSRLSITIRDGRRVYKVGENELDPGLIVQIDRNPGYAAHGCSALSAYAQMCWGLLAAGNQSLSVTEGGIPLAVLQNVTAPKLTKDQAEAAQTQWMTAVARRNGAPPVIDKNWQFTPLSFSPADLSLLDTQKWNSEVIATAFGVPSVLLNMALQGGLTYQNPAALGEMWWRFELKPTAKRISDALTAQMLPAGQEVWFDAADTFLPLTETSDDPQASAVAKASPAQQTQPRLTAIGGSG